MSGEAFGEFSVKLTHAMNVPLDAVGVGMCAILYMTLPVPSPRERFGGKKGAVGSCFGEGGLNFTGKSQCLDPGPCRLQRRR